MQKKLWEKEYKKDRSWPSSYRTEPSKALVEFFNEGYEVSGPALDVGSGFDRNSIYLASRGFGVIGVDMVDYAIVVAKEKAKAANVLDKITFIEHSVSSPLPYPDEYFGLIVDMMTMHLLDVDERNVFAKEVLRFLKAGGYFVFYTISAESPEAQRLVREHPADEPNSYVIPQNGMVEHAFAREELTKLFSPLGFVKFKSVIDKTEFLGKIYEREYYSVVMT